MSQNSTTTLDSERVNISIIDHLGLIIIVFGLFPLFHPINNLSVVILEPNLSLYNAYILFSSTFSENNKNAPKPGFGQKKVEIVSKVAFLNFPQLIRKVI